MASFFGSRLRERLSFLVEDFDLEHQFKLDLAQGRLRLQRVRLSRPALALVTEQLCCFAPICAENAFVRELTVELRVSDSTRVSVEGVDLEFATLPAERWAVEQLRDTCQAAKRRQLELHAKVLRFGCSEGDGFLHSLAAAALDSLELTVDGLSCRLADRSSLQVADAPRPFLLGGGVGRAALLRGAAGQAASPDVLLRRVRVSEPHAWLDELAAVPPGGTRSASSSGRPRGRFEGEGEEGAAGSSPGGRQSRQGPGGPVAQERAPLGEVAGEGEQHAWILRPDPELRCELALLQCRRPARAAPRATAGAGWGSGELVGEHDFADLAEPLHAPEGAKAGGNTTTETRAWYAFADAPAPPLPPPLPRAGAMLGAAGARLRLSTRQVEALVALATYAVLGYGAVLRGVRAGAGAPTPAAVEQYKHAWLQAAFLGALPADCGAAAAAFERDAPVEAVMRAREEVLAVMLRERGGGAAAVAAVPSLAAGPPPDRGVWCSAGRGGFAALAVDSSDKEWERAAELAKQALAARDPGWQRAWRRLSEVGTIAVVGARLRDVTLDVELHDEAVSDVLRFTVEDIVASVALHHDRAFAQTSLVEFRVEDHFGPKKLQRLYAGRPLAMPLSTVLVRSEPTASEVAAAGATTPGTRSELYMAVGQRFRRSSTGQPDGTLSLRTFGELHVSVPPTQLLLLGLALVTPSLQFTLGRCFAGAAWRLAASEEVVAVARHGVEAAREVWARAAEGVSDKWTLDVEIEPVRLFIPVPGTHSSGPPLWGAGAWAEAYVLCLGRVAGSSVLQPRQAGIPLASEQHPGPLGASTCYDRYDAQVIGLTFERRQRRGRATRLLLPPAVAEVSLYVCHWTAIELPQALVHYQASSIEVNLTAEDIQALLGALSEVVGVAASAAAAAAARALMLTKEALQQLRVSRTSQQPLPRVGYSGQVGRLSRAVFQQAPVAGTKLWDVVVGFESVRVTLDMPGSNIPQDQHLLEVELYGQTMKGFACLDGSMRWTYSIKHLEVSSHDGVKLLRGPPQRADADGGAHHATLAWVLEAPQALDGEWLLWVDAAVHRPTIVLWWPAVHACLSAAIHCAAEVQGQRLLIRESSLPSFEALLGGPRLVQHCLALDRVYFCSHIFKAEVLVPVVCDKEGLRPRQRRRLRAFQGPGGDAPLLSLRATLQSTLDVQRRPPGAASGAPWLPNLEVTGLLLGAAADFVVPEHSTLHGRRPWLLPRGRGGALALLEPFRSSAGVSVAGGRSLTVRFQQEPLRAAVFPAIAGLLLQLGAAAREALLPLWSQPQGFGQEPKVSKTLAGDDRFGIPQEAALQEISTREVPWCTLSGRAGRGAPEKLRLQVRLEAQAVVLSFADMPGKAAPIHAEVALEDLCCHLSAIVTLGGQSRWKWSSRLEGLGRIDVLNALSLQVEPVLEPVHWLWRGSCDSRRHAFRGHCMPEGELNISWVNLNLPVGAFHAAKLWLQSEEALRHHQRDAVRAAAARRPGGSPALYDCVDVGRPVVRLDSDSSLVCDVPGHLSTTSPTHKGDGSSQVDVLDGGLLDGCRIINALGETIAVRLVEDDGATQGAKWHIVPPTRERSAATEPLQAGPSATKVPRLAIRGLLRGHMFELLLTACLHAGQSEVVQLKVPAATDAQAVSLHVGAVSDQGGQGCALLVSTTAVLRNSTEHNLVWTAPMPDLAGGLRLRMLTADGGRAVDLRQPTTARPKPRRGQEAVAAAAPAAGTRMLQVRWRHGVGRSTDNLGTGAQHRAHEVEKVLAPREQAVLPLSWLAAAAADPDSVAAAQLCIGVTGMAARAPLLPSSTLRALGRFDFAQPHRVEELRVRLPGALVELQDANGRPLHLCCTLNVGLLGEQACCLEISVSSCICVVNHLPLPVTVSYKFRAAALQAFASQRGQAESSVLVPSGGHCKEYLDAEELSLEVETEEGVTCFADLAVRAGKPFASDEVIQLNLAPHGKRRDAAKSKLSHMFQERELKRRGGDRAVTIMVKTSSSFALEPPPLRQRSNEADPWLEQLRFFHPPEWETHRKALTLFVRCWVENCSTQDVWLRPRGAHGAGAELHAPTGQLHVPPCQRRLLLSRMAAAGALRLAADERAPRRQTAEVRWGGARREVAKTLRCLRPGASSLHLGLTVMPASYPFLESQVIRLYDSVTLLNLLDTHLLCLSATSFVLQGAEPQASAWVEKAGGLERLDCRTQLTAVRFASADVCDVATEPMLLPSAAQTPRDEPPRQVSVAALSGNSERPSHPLRKATKYAHQVSLEKPCSFQVRCRSAPSTDLLGGWLYNNVSVSVRKLHQGAATLVSFEPGEPCFIVRNEAATAVCIRQKNVLSEWEVLAPGEELPFVWYDPHGTLELQVQAFSDSPTQTGAAAREPPSPTLLTAGGASKGPGGQSTSTLGAVGGGDEALGTALDFDPRLGQEVMRILSHQDLREWQQQSGANKSGEDPTEVSSSEGALTFCLEGLGLALSDASPRQFLYVALDRLEVSVSLSSTALDLERVPAVGHVTTYRACHPVNKFSSLADGGHTYSKLLRDEVLCPSHLVHIGTAEDLRPTPLAADPASAVVLLRSLLSAVPPLDVRLSVLNLQADSHIPGSFFPCVLRPFGGRSHLWRSLRCFSPARPSPKWVLRKPVLSAHAEGIQVLGSALVLNSFRAELDKLVVNVDEAMLVAVGSYYCRIALLFDLPPFASEQPAIAPQQSQEAVGLQLRQDEHRVGEAEKQAGIQRRSAISVGWRIRVEDTLDIGETTAYLSLRLIESSSPYVESLQRDSHTSLLLGRLAPFYSAAAFQPAMIATSTRPLLGQRVSMSPAVLAKMINEHFIDPIQSQFCWLLVVSFDLIGSPVHLLRGVAAGLRELVWQPRRHGLRGIPWGLQIFLCSVGGSVFDMMARISNSLFKGVDRAQHVLYGRLGMRITQRGASVLALSRAPSSAGEGLRRGCQLFLLQLHVVASAARDVAHWFVDRAHRRSCRLGLYLVLFLIALTVTILLGVLNAVLLFIHNVLQGVVMSLYRRSAEAVSDLAPLQLFALELPTHCRPPRPLLQPAQPLPSGQAKDAGGSSNDGAPAGASAAVEGSRGWGPHGRGGGVVLLPQFAYLPSLAWEQLESEEALPAWLNRRRRGDAARRAGRDDRVVSATWCSSSTASDWEASVLVDTGRHVALLRISGWGATNAEGRPSQPKASYRWAWRVPCADVACISLHPPGPKSADWVLRLELDAEGPHHKPRVVPFGSEAQAHRAFETLAYMALGKVGSL